MKSNIIYSAGIALCVTAFWSVVAAGPMKQAGSAEVKKTAGGTYAIYQLENEVGQESYTMTVYSNNRVKYDSEYYFYVTGMDTMMDQTSMLLEEDSYLPLSYYCRIKLRNTVSETRTELYSNVAVTTTKRGEHEVHSKKVVATGAAVLQMKYVYVLGIILRRYDEPAGGKQMLDVFDPVAGTGERINIERIGPAETNIGTKNVTLNQYDILRERGGVVTIYTDGANNIIKAVDNARKLDFVLTDSWEKEG